MVTFVCAASHTLTLNREHTAASCMYEWLELMKHVHFIENVMQVNNCDLITLKQRLI